MTKNEYEYEYLADNKTTAAAAAAAAQQQQQQQQQRKMDDGTAALEPAAPGRAIHVHRIGRLLHVLHFPVTSP